jgi:hypothetical protein
MTFLMGLLSVLLIQTPAQPAFGSISGEIRDSQGIPAAGGVWVSAAREQPNGRFRKNWWDETDAQGRYQLELPAGRYRIALEDFYGAKIDASDRIVTVVAGETRTANLALNIPYVPAVRPAVLAGRLTFDDGSPLEVGTLEQFQLVLTSGTARFVTQPFTNTQGIFTFHRALPGDYTVTTAPLWLGYYLKSITYGNIDLTQAPLSLKSGANDSQIQVVLTTTPPPGTPPGVKVSGRIADWKGRGPLALAVMPTPSEFYRVAHVDPGNDGSFEINGVPPGRYSIGTSILENSVIFDVGRNEVPNLALILEKRGIAAASTPTAATAPGSVAGIVDIGNRPIPEFEVGFAAVGARAPASYRVQVSGRQFSTTIPEGEYRITISGLPLGYAVVSVTAGPLDLTQPFLLTSKGVADRFTGLPVTSAAGAGITIKLSAPTQ